VSSTRRPFGRGRSTSRVWRRAARIRDESERESPSGLPSIDKRVHEKEQPYAQLCGPSVRDLTLAAAATLFWARVREHAHPHVRFRPSNRACASRTRQAPVRSRSNTLETISPSVYADAVWTLRQERQGPRRIRAEGGAVSHGESQTTQGADRITNPLRSMRRSGQAVRHERPHSWEPTDNEIGS
jgi:hypothetical protein